MNDPQGPLCVVCKAVRVKRHELARGWPAVCDGCQRSNQSLPSSQMFPPAEAKA